MLIAVLAAAFLVAATTATASAAACPTRWGSQAKELAPLGQAPVRGVRVGSQACYDRLVVDVAGAPIGFRVEYVDTVLSEGRGEPLFVPGGARLAVVLHHPAGSLPYLVNQKAADVSGFPVLRSVTYGGSFEGFSTYGVGVRARLPFRVFTLTNPGRIVLDVARSW